MKKRDEGFSFVILIIVMIVVTVLLVTGIALATSNFESKSSETQRIDTTYDAESAMSEIRAGIENDLKAVITECYESVLSTSSTIPASRLDDEFKYLVISDLDLKFTGTQHLPSGDFTPIGTYGDWANDAENHNQHIDDYIVHKDGVTITHFPEFVANYNDSTFTFKNVSVEYVDPRGIYSGRVTADIKFTVPAVFYTGNTFNSSVYSDYSIIADDCLNIEHASVDGNVYAGEDGINVGASNTSPATFNSELVVTRGNLSIFNQGKAIFTDSTLYANNVETIRGGAAAAPASDYEAFQFNGTACLNGDLLLNVPNASIRMAGRYYGFNTSDNQESSGFSVNASYVNADLSGLDEFFLGGTSYIKIPTLTEAQDVITGDSVTGKFMQSIYLVPSACITVVRNGHRINASNPIRLSELDSLQVNLSRNKAVGGIDLMPYVNPTGSQYRTVVTRYSVGNSLDNNRVYIYIRFKDAKSAAAYAMNFAETNPNYVPDRAESFHYGNIAINENSTIVTKGNVITNDSVNGVNIKTFSTDEAFSAAQWQGVQCMNTYNSLCSNLGTSASVSFNSSLFDYFIDSDVIAGDEQTSVADGKILCNKVCYDKIITSSYTGDNFRVIVANDDVRIDQDFTGLIITTGDVTCNSNIKIAGLIISRKNVNIKAGEFDNITANGERPCEYILGLSDEKNEILSYFRITRGTGVTDFDVKTLNLQGSLCYEGWNTR